MEQQILVDFDSFPKKLAQLLELCRYSVDHDEVNFSCHLELEGESARFELVEFSEFKRMLQFALPLVKGDDHTVMLFLARRWADARNLSLTRPMTNQVLALSSFRAKRHFVEASARIEELECAL